MDRVDNWVGAAFGLLFTGLAAASLWRSRLARRWPTTPGRVIEIATQRGSRGSKSLQVRYEYEVGGIHYEADRLSFGLIGVRSPEKVVVQMLSLKPGDSVQVHYDPGRPAHATLRPGATLTTYWFLAMGLAFLITSVGAMLGLPRAAP
jgi:Protein of unknown function (DUF3592)